MIFIFHLFSKFDMFIDYGLMCFSNVFLTCSHREKFQITVLIEWYLYDLMMKSWDNFDTTTGNFHLFQITVLVEWYLYDLMMKFWDNFDTSFGIFSFLCLAYLGNLLPRSLIRLWMTVIN